MFDTRGADINVGDYIIYAVTAGRTARMRFGIVTKVLGGRDNRLSVTGYSVDWTYKSGNKKYYVTKQKGTISWADVKSMVCGLNTFPDVVIKEILKEKIT